MKRSVKSLIDVAYDVDTWKSPKQSIDDSKGKAVLGGKCITHKYNTKKKYSKKQKKKKYRVFYL